MAAHGLKVSLSGGIMNHQERFVLPRMGRVNRIHFVGIGGAGMSGIAEVLHDEGYVVSGSDLAENRTVLHLRSIGMTVWVGHLAAHVHGADVVVRSSAVAEDNAEILEARAQMIPVIPRAMMLAELMRYRHGIAIAGTHGKTTTTSLVTTLLQEGGFDPTFVIGGKLTSCGSNAQHGTSAYFVAEADESDASFLFLKPTMAVVTNIDADHMSTYGNDFDQLREAFIEFLHHLPFYGLAVVCVDDPHVAGILPKVQRPTVTYGFHEQAHYRAVDWVQDGLLSRFVVHRPASHPPLQVEMNWPGRHNVLNALAAIAIATELKVADAAIVSGLLRFQGVGRRFQIIGDAHFLGGSALVIDDYGHHPQEIAATMAAFRAVWPNRRLVHVFQPHRYTRTQALFDDFVAVLGTSEVLMLFDIYPAGETAISGVNSEALLRQMRANRQVVMTVNEATLRERLNEVIVDGDVILVQGAGSIGQVAHQLIHSVPQMLS